MSHIETRLVVYGSLAPGEVNHIQLGPAGQGQWQPCQIKAHAGMIGPWRIVTLDDQAPVMQAQLLTSAHLPDIWVPLDAFEGQAYRRMPCQAETADGVIEAYIYVASGLPLED